MAYPTPSTCIGCDLTFRGIQDFEKHRRGPHGYCATHQAAAHGNHCDQPEPHSWRANPNRRCMTVPEMLAAGFMRDAKDRLQAPKSIPDASTSRVAA
jgi:hypothetical protein